ncbi:glutathione peroxidase [Mucilaginibacter mallensis]|uniref:Glutathione peroxidase n=1 Tax=Mucilaginibacter mallensis TaxID=652787 RepID=A0A1H2C2I3_MUCMA|nr:glutathione peroxidase [Mucilaginibacter mallensis]SDT64623.1 glutathione peroxidase [Mucilaginibacter mallensis]
MKLLAIFLTLMLITPAAEVYQFKLKTIDGQDFSLAKYKGKKILVVNTASKCGYTPQYADLQKLADLYKDKVVVVGFPENNFAGQEPGTNAEIKSFCTGKYNVTFPLSEKVSVKGDDIAPLFKYLTEAPNPDFTGEVKWNFEKFLLDENGKLIHRYRSAVKPLDPAITNAL